MALEWRQKRKLVIEIVLSVLVLGLLAIFAVPRFSSAPSCFDGKQNGDEVGVDCGGSCQLFCSSQISELSLSWARVFPAAGNFYNALAVVENQNAAAGVQGADYEFKFYDANNIFIKDYQGRTFLGLGRNPIFAGPIDLEGKIPVRIVFNLVGEKRFLKVRSEIVGLNISVLDRRLVDLENRPKLFVRLVNRSRYALKDVEFVAILYDREDNAINVSKTFLENLAPNEEKEISFTWQKPLEREVSRIEVLPRLNPFLPLTEPSF